MHLFFQSKVKDLETYLKAALFDLITDLTDRQLRRYLHKLVTPQLTISYQKIPNCLSDGMILSKTFSIFNRIEISRQSKRCLRNFPEKPFKSLHTTSDRLFPFRFILASIRLMRLIILINSSITFGGKMFILSRKS